jgi:hypothetical protein
MLRQTLHPASRKPPPGFPEPAAPWRRRRDDLEARLAEEVARLVADYGGPGSPEVIEGLSSGGHSALRRAAAAGHARAVSVLLAAYGSAGCDAVLDGLSAEGHGALQAARYHGHEAIERDLLAAYGARRLFARQCEERVGSVGGLEGGGAEWSKAQR